MAVLCCDVGKPSRGLAAAAVALLLAAGCQSTPAPTSHAKGVELPYPPPEPAAMPAPERKPAPVPKTKPLAPPTREQLQALGVDERRPLTTGSIIGLEFDEVRRLLGEPTLRLDDPPARIWQYQAAECTLRLTFFPEVNTQRYRTLSIALGNSEGDTEDAKSRCLNAIHADVRRS